MQYRIKNLTGDPTNVDTRLHQAVKLYATSDRYQSYLPINAQETVVVSEHAYTELTTNFPNLVSVLDLDGIEHTDVPNRHKNVCDGTWQYVDLERYAGMISITNANAVNGDLLQFSFSGFTSPATTPPASTISDVLGAETITIDTPMSPIRFIYLKGTNNSVAYVLSN